MARMVTHDRQNRIPWPEKREQGKGLRETSKWYLKNKYIKTALVLALLWAWWDALYTTLKDTHQDTIETVKDTGWYPFERHHLAYRDDNTTYSAEHLELKKEQLAPWVKVIRDAWLTFYVVQKDDIKEKKTTYFKRKTVKVKKGKKTVSKRVKDYYTVSSHEADFDKIRHKLSRIPEFSYLTDNEYDRSKPGTKTKSFNIPRESVKAGMYIPIPLNHTVRELSPQDFANYCHEAITEMKTPESPYSHDINQLLANVSEKDIIIAMLSFARSETAEEYTNFVQPFGDVELHRREPAFKAFSFTYFHILMEKNADRKTPWPGLEARLKLWLTEGQCYHPKNAAKLFLAYRIEKTNGKLDKVFPLTHDNIKEIGTRYNWSSTYAVKLRPNFDYITKLMNKEIVYYDNAQLLAVGFNYTWLNSKFEHIYRFKTPKWVNNNDQLKKLVVKEFNKHKAASCPTIDEDAILSLWGEPITWPIVPDTICIHITATPS